MLRDFLFCFTSHAEESCCEFWLYVTTLGLRDLLITVLFDALFFLDLSSCLLGCPLKYYTK